jgi:hypothetical protein
VRSLLVVPVVDGGDAVQRGLLLVVCQDAVEPSRS